MTEVQGLLRSSWIIGYVIYLGWMGFCMSFGYLGGFLVSLIGGDWYQFLDNSDSNCFGYITPFF